jgi:hypothetical protein
VSQHLTFDVYVAPQIPTVSDDIPPRAEQRCLYLAESSPEGRKDWIAALDTIESPHPRAVIAGHKRRDRADDPRIIEETRQYIRDFDRIAESADSARELYDRMLAIHPGRVNPGALWGSARAWTTA